MKKIGIIGDKDSVLGFMAAGFSVFVTDNPGQAEEILENAVKNDFAVMYITEELLSELSDVYDKYRGEPMLSIIPLPSKNGSLGIGMANIKKSVERAVGADILKD